MKKLRKLVSLLLAVVMIMGLCVVVTADTGSITVTNTTVGETYKVYKMLDVTYSGTTYSYTIDSSSDWFAFFVDSSKSSGNLAQDSISSYVTVTKVGDTYYVTWSNTSNDTTTAQTFGALASTYAETYATATDSKDATDTTVEFTDLDLGYYLVTSTVGSLVSLDTTDANMTVVDKNAKPTITKLVSSDGTTYSGSNTAEFNDTVYYQVKIVGIDEISSLTLHDLLPTGFTLGTVTIELYADSSDNSPATLSTSTDYVLNNPSTSCVSDCSFEIVFDNLLSSSNTNYSTKVTSENAYIVVTYTATIKGICRCLY